MSGGGGCLGSLHPDPRLRRTTGTSFPFNSPRRVKGEQDISAKYFKS